MKKYWQFLKISFMTQISYRGDFLISFFVKIAMFLSFLFIWRKIAEDGNEIEGYGLSGIILYYLLMQIMDGFFSSKAAKKVREDIKQGYLSTHLNKPFIVPVYYMISHFARVLVENAMYIFISIPIFVIFPSLLKEIDIDLFWMFRCFIISVCSSLIGFNVFFMVGNAAFWLKEALSIQMIIKNLARFLTGSLIPIDLLPVWFQRIVLLTPFPYILYFPVKIFMDKSTMDEFFEAMLIIFIWIVILILLNIYLWKKGLKQYEAVGI